MICEVVSKCVHVTVEGGGGQVAPGLMSIREFSAAPETTAFLLEGGWALAG